MTATRISVKFHHTDSMQNASSIGLDSKESTCSVGDLGSIPGLERSLEKCKAIDFSILTWRIPMDRRAW